MTTIDLSKFNGAEFGIEANNKAEADFFLSHLKPHHRVLEWGSGASTITIASRVELLVSIENNIDWYNKLVDQVPPNVTLLYKPANSNPDPGHDGTALNFTDYIFAPAVTILDTEADKFDIIFIDGRARVECAKICKKIAKKDALVFIHDYNHPDPKYTRHEYFEAEKYLDRLGGEFTMWKFKIKE